MNRSGISWTELMPRGETFPLDLKPESATADCGKWLPGDWSWADPSLLGVARRDGDGGYRAGWWARCSLPSVL